mmetsp:Transcript_83955/g.116695  ORF Transcript_83955/g.116695 Transcript_83955/m.116695 type:complete len:236 (-) Transcript_83955:182-889(-)
MVLFACALLQPQSLDKVLVKLNTCQQMKKSDSKLVAVHPSPERICLLSAIPLAICELILADCPHVTTGGLFSMQTKRFHGQTSHLFSTKNSASISRNTTRLSTRKFRGLIGVSLPTVITRSMTFLNAHLERHQRSALISLLVHGNQCRPPTRACTSLQRTSIATPQLVCGWNCGTTTLASFCAVKSQFMVALVLLMLKILMNLATLRLRHVSGDRPKMVLKPLLSCQVLPSELQH